MYAYAKALFACAFLVLIHPGCSSGNATKNTSPPLSPPPSALDREVVRDRVFITAQPSEAEIRSLPGKGITCVFNVRSPEEMSDKTQVPFAEDSVVIHAGMHYAQVPIGGEKYPYVPETLEAFAKVMQADTGKILLHCKSGGRTAWLYAAYELKYLGKSPQEIMKWLERYGFWPLPIEKLTGIPLEIRKLQ
jgi:protein tyrosine phosphatase (PTP) superfamily phosphohydrolase (DUF442 family)